MMIAEFGLVGGMLRRQALGPARHSSDWQTQAGRAAPLEAALPFAIGQKDKQSESLGDPFTAPWLYFADQTPLVGSAASHHRHLPRAFRGR